MALSYFRWVQKQNSNQHSQEAYDMLLIFLAYRKHYDHLQNIFEEMSIAGYESKNTTCVNLVQIYINSKMLTQAVEMLLAMRKLKFRPAFSAFTTLIGALVEAHEPDKALTMFKEMQEIGYEVSTHLFTTMVRAFSKEGKLDAALALLDEKKSNSLGADVVFYNVCIDCFGKVGKMGMAWKFFHEMKAQNITPDDVTYAAMIGVLCKANRLDEALELLVDLLMSSHLNDAESLHT